MFLLHRANPSPEEPPGTNFVAPGLAATLENYAVAQLLREFIDLAEFVRLGGRNQEWLMLTAAACGWDDMLRKILDKSCLMDTRVDSLDASYSTTTSDLALENLPAISLAAG
ncbi:hypothetical protein N7505_001600 [Penicillium chrysogenum]|jgi:hypothetical protein|uniref:Uncharacterized protein n=1 Tax=Penicillium chrysogenum TaxID=5076 RepID=A0ABQ8WX60_PENCH|nr:hypothetical protein N7505_001600 [Penicillium chrysogenum]